ncbi:hypothetical protein [Actinophytocola sp.]|uniref:hypothetical protein n=1 Tax=Actinophytocola sp. TaxID=1872138 RepID=UPI0025BF1F9D|nr:hypothetical protein [Actinophytocola sp.]
MFRLPISTGLLRLRPGLRVAALLRVAPLLRVTALLRIATRLLTRAWLLSVAGLPSPRPWLLRRLRHRNISLGGDLVAKSGVDVGVGRTDPTAGLGPDAP